MREIVVGVADAKFSNNHNDVLVTYALGSCIAVAIYDPIAKVGGLLHFMLPDSSIDPVKAKESPGMFADTGATLLFRSCYGLGAEKKRMKVKIAGGASIIDNGNYFRIGEKNVMSLRKIFWKNNVLIDAEDVGKNHNRTVRLEIATGKFYVKSPLGQQLEL